MRRRDSLRLCAATLAAGLVGSGTAALARPAAERAVPVMHGPADTDAVVLRIAGLIRRPPQGEREFTLAQLEALGLTSYRTVTPWDRGLRNFSGVPLARLLEAVECLGSFLDAEAINRYTTSIPVADAQLGAFIATRLEGQPMRVRDRGPLWLLYPWSDRPELDRSLYHERAIWQLRHIAVR
ncbi:molybdopterin-dependent oxidoreductase [Roseomonas sp. 18066]|uniref:molybdopterin-dependent oxidoreductase n=1 Tax=Roseomonas sp. 18066 TaxID=2681412 RepID=UPI001357F326|nr:molybdopterin-dependent oxidoreductase [Roseomonas sp. 18066]